MEDPPVTGHTHQQPHPERDAEFTKGCKEEHRVDEKERKDPETKITDLPPSGKEKNGAVIKQTPSQPRQKKEHQSANLPFDSFHDRARLSLLFLITLCSTGPIMPGRIKVF